MSHIPGEAIFQYNMQVTIQLTLPYWTVYLPHPLTKELTEHSVPSCRTNWSVHYRHITPLYPQLIHRTILHIALAVFITRVISDVDSISCREATANHYIDSFLPPPYPLSHPDSKGNNSDGNWKIWNNKLALWWPGGGCVILCSHTDAGLLLQNRPRLLALQITIYSTSTRHCIVIDKVSVNNLLTLLSPVATACTSRQFNIQ